MKGEEEEREGDKDHYRLRVRTYYMKAEATATAHTPTRRFFWESQRQLLPKIPNNKEGLKGCSTRKQ